MSLRGWRAASATVRRTSAGSAAGSPDPARDVCGIAGFGRLLGGFHGRRPGLPRLGVRLDLLVVAFDLGGTGGGGVTDRLDLLRREREFAIGEPDLAGGVLELLAGPVGGVVDGLQVLGGLDGALAEERGVDE